MEIGLVTATESGIVRENGAHAPGATPTRQWWKCMKLKTADVNGPAEMRDLRIPGLAEIPTRRGKSTLLWMLLTNWMLPEFMDQGVSTNSVYS